MWIFLLRGVASINTYNSKIDKEIIICRSEVHELENNVFALRWISISKMDKEIIICRSEVHELENNVLHWDEYWRVNDQNKSSCIIYYFTRYEVIFFL